MTQQMIDVIQAHMRGEKIEFEWKVSPGHWWPAPVPEWDFTKFEYRIAPEPKIPDSIDWSHVSPEFNFIARDSYHGARLFQSKPTVRKPNGQWHGEDALVEGYAGCFASYKRGNMDWQDSLVERPKP